MATFTQTRGSPAGDRRDCESFGRGRRHAPLHLWSSERKSEQQRNERSPVPCVLPIAFRPHFGQARHSGGALLAASRPCPRPDAEMPCVCGGLHCPRHRNRALVFDGGDPSAEPRPDLAGLFWLPRREADSSGMAATGTLISARIRADLEGCQAPTGDSKCPSGRQSLTLQTSTPGLPGPLPRRRRRV
jgi:hypothetical protein